MMLAPEPTSHTREEVTKSYFIKVTIPTIAPAVRPSHSNSCLWRRKKYNTIKHVQAPKDRARAGTIILKVPGETARASTDSRNACDINGKKRIDTVPIKRPTS